MTTMLVSPVIQQVLRAFSGMLLHSLWQGLVLSALAGLTILLTAKTRSSIRYGIISVLLLLFPVVSAFTFVNELKIHHAENDSSLTDSVMGNLFYGNGITSAFNNFIHFCSNNAHLIVTIWFVFFLLKCIQISIGFSYVSRIKRKGLYEPEAKWLAVVEKLSQQLNVTKKVTLLESGLTKIPLVIGFLKPVIYMPIGLLNHLPAEQVEAVLLHELAHIRRHDYLVNIFQQFAESIFFFNPGFLWVSAILKREREHCCDDIALHHLHARKQFVEALVSFTKHSLYGTSYTTAFPGTKNQLMKRVVRITYNKNDSLSGFEKTFFAVSISLSVALTAILGNGSAFQRKNVQSYTSPVIRSTGIIKESVHQEKTFAKNIEPVPSNNETAKGNKEISKTSTENVAVFTSDRTDVDETNPTEIVSQPDEYIRDLQSYQADLSIKQQLLNVSQKAELDRLQADRDREQANIDRERADRDREQAIKDREQADRDRQQADRDRVQAENDRRQAEVDRQQNENYRQKNLQNKIQAQHNKTTSI